MAEITIRELRNHGGEVVDRVAQGEQIIVTRAGKPVAELRPLGRRPLTAASDERERASRQAHLQEAEADFDPLPFDRASARAFGQVAASLRRSGRKPAARAYDALIAATAMAHGLPVYTCNAADFEGIDGLEVIPVRLP
jgi:tRNA(fMet)-specific endonuclease VapC